MDTQPTDIVTFWHDAGPDAWFIKSDDFDAAVNSRFRTVVIAARAGALDHWISEATSALALLLLLDQFPRHIFRETAEMFTSDAKALVIANDAISRGHDGQLPTELRPFVYMAFMHSEALADQERSLALFTTLGDETNLKFAEDHADIIRRFGRYPHRNAILGRTSTPKELAFLAEGGFAG